MSPAREMGLMARFAVVGALGFCLDGGLLAVGTAMGAPVSAARAVSLFGALHLTFLLNGAFVFRALRRDNLGRQWAGYMLANGLGALCNYVVFLGLIGSGLPLASAPVVAFVTAAAVALAVNFTGSRLIAFRA
jgi:putative flippase GtrA